MDNLIRLVGAPCQDHTILYLPNDGNGQDDADEVLIILLLESSCPSVTKFRQHHIHLHLHLHLQIFIILFFLFSMFHREFDIYIYIYIYIYKSS